MNKSAASFRCEPGFSTTLLTILVMAHGTAAAAILCSPWPAWIQAICLMAVLSGAVLGIRRCLREGHVKALSMVKDGSWRLVLAGGRECRGELSGRSLAGRWFCLLEFRCPEGRLRVLIARDSLDAASFRRLRVALRVIGPTRPPRSADAPR